MSCVKVLPYDIEECLLDILAKNMLLLNMFLLYWHMVEFFTIPESPEWLCRLKNVTKASINILESSNGWNFYLWIYYHITLKKLRGLTGNRCRK